MALGRFFQLALAVTRKILKDQQYDFNVAIARFIDEEFPGPFSIISDPADGLRSFGAVNSLCEPNFGYPDWTATQSTVRFPHVGLTDLQHLDSCLLNGLGAAVAPGEYRYQFVLPAGSTGATFSLDLAEPSSKPVTIGFYDTNMSTVLASKVLATTPGFQTFSVSFTNAFPSPHLYGMFVQTDVGGVQAQPSAAYARLVPTFPTGTFGTGPFAKDPVTHGLNFRRLGLTQAMAFGNQLAGVNSGLYPRVNPFSEYTVHTNGGVAAVEAFNIASDGVLWTFQNGQPLQKIGDAVSIPNGGLGLVELLLAVAADKSTQPFRVRAGEGSGPASLATLGTGTNLVAPRALYLPGSAALFVVPKKSSTKRGILYGDSITGGNLAAEPGFQGWFSIFREWYPGELIVDASASTALLNLVGPGDLPQSQKLFAQYLARSAPTDIILDLGTNDYAQGSGGNAWTAAAFQTALLGVVTNLLALAPQARIWLKSIGITTLEGVANGAGSTPPQYRAVPAAVAAAVNDPRVIAIDATGAGFWTAAQLVDPFHPNETGQGMGAQAMIGIFAAAFAI